MQFLGAILLLAFLGTVEPYKFGLKPQTEIDNQPPPPPPSQPQPPPVQQPERLEQQQTLLYPNSDYVQHEQKYEASGVKGGLKGGERELINRQPSTGYLPNSQPQALAYVIVRPLQYNPSTYGVTYGNGGSYPYGNGNGNGYGYNNGYNRPPYNPYNQNPYNQNPYGPYNPYSPYSAQQGNLLQSENPSLKDETQQLEEEYPTKGGVKQAAPQPDQQQQQQQQQQPQQVEGFDLYAEKKGKLQRLVDKIHSIFPFGSTYQINDEVPPQNPPPAQPQPPPQPQPAQPERAPVQQIREPIPEQQTLSQLHDEQEIVREPEPIHQEPLREEKGHSKPYRETTAGAAAAVGELKRERDYLNNQQVKLSQEPDYTNAGFASSKRVSTN